MFEGVTRVLARKNSVRDEKAESANKTGICAAWAGGGAASAQWRPRELFINSTHRAADKLAR